MVIKPEFFGRPKAHPYWLKRGLYTATFGKYGDLLSLPAVLDSNTMLRATPAGLSLYQSGGAQSQGISFPKLNLSARTEIFRQYCVSRRTYGQWLRCSNFDFWSGQNADTEFKYGISSNTWNSGTTVFIGTSPVSLVGKPRTLATVWDKAKNSGYGRAFVDGIEISRTGGTPQTVNSDRTLSSTANTVGPYQQESGTTAFLAFSESLSDGEIIWLSANPGRVCLPPPGLLLLETAWLPLFAGGAGALAGNAAAQVSASGALSISVPLVGAATSVATASGTLTTQSPLAGSATVVATATGELSVTFTLSGAALVNALAAGAISTSVALSGSALANALATGNLLAGGAGALAGNAAAQASASGSLSTAIPLQGAASALAVATGGLTTAFPLVGVAAAVSHVTGDLTVTFGGALSGDAVAQVLAAGALSIQVALSGSAVAHALATGILGSGDVPNTPQDTWDRALQALFDPFYGDFGEPAVVAGTPVVGMFSSRAQDSFGIVQPSAAVLRMSATHVAAVGDTVTVGARTYQIAAIHDLDGSGTEKTLELK